MAQIFLGLGSNLGKREEYIRSTIAALAQNNIKIEIISSLTETDPVGGPPQGKFLNAVVQAQTTLSPEELLTCLQGIEKKLGRVRTVPNGPRTIDIDILLYDDIQMDLPHLRIPHPRMKERAFVLNPLTEIAPGMIHRLEK